MRWRSVPLVNKLVGGSSSHALQLSAVAAVLALGAGCGLLGGGKEEESDTDGPCAFSSCDEHAKCSNVDDVNYTCTCDKAYFGDGGTCYPKRSEHGDCDQPNGGDIVCECDPGYMHPHRLAVGCDDIDECALPDDGGCEAYCVNTVGSLDCISTVSDPSSEYWGNTCDPTMSIYAKQTDFKVDCRCGVNRTELPICMRPADVADSISFGEGPSLRELSNLRGYGGVFDTATRKMYLGMGWTNPNTSYAGEIVEVDADSGDRRVVSGFWPDRFGGTDFGTGPFLNEVQNLAFGPDGNLYAWARDIDNLAQIVRVNRTTGDRTLLWKEANRLTPDVNNPAHAQCDNGSSDLVPTPQIWERGLLVEPDGSFLINVLPQGTTVNMTPSGILRIAPDGSSCEWMTRTGAGSNNRWANQNIGRGNAPQPGARYGAMIWHKEKIWAIDTFTNVYEIDPANGDRVSITTGIAEDWMSWDEARQMMWMTGAGGGATNIQLYDPEANAVWDFNCAAPGGPELGCMQGPITTCCNNHLPTFHDPVDGNLFVWHSVYGMLKFEASTGNSYVFSL